MKIFVAALVPGKKHSIVAGKKLTEKVLSTPNGLAALARLLLPAACTH